MAYGNKPHYNDDTGPTVGANIGNNESIETGMQAPSTPASVQDPGAPSQNNEYNVAIRVDELKSDSVFLGKGISTKEISINFGRPEY